MVCAWHTPGRAGECVIKMCKYQQVPAGQSGPVFHELRSTSKWLRQQSSRPTCSKHEASSEYCFMLVVRIMSLNRACMIHSVRERVKGFNPEERCVLGAQKWDTAERDSFACFVVPWIRMISASFCRRPFVSSEAVITVHFQTKCNQGLKKKIR